MFKTDTTSSIDVNTLDNNCDYSFTTNDQSENENGTLLAASENTPELSSSTAVASAKLTRSDFVKQFSLLAAKTAMAILEMCKVVSDAHAALDKSEFTKFCADIGHKDDDSTIKKYLAIGQAYPRFIAYADRLPNAWTSIYSITQISEDKFSELMSTNVSMKKMTGHAIRKIIGKSDSMESTCDVMHPSAMIYFKKEPSVAQWNYFQTFLANFIFECKELGLYYKLTPKYKKLIKDLKEQNRREAKFKKKQEAMAQKRLEERDVVYRPDIFDYGDAFDVERGEFVI